MLLKSILVCAASAVAVLAAPSVEVLNRDALDLAVRDASTATKQKAFLNWRTYKANGVNLGAWLEREYNFDPEWFNTVAPNATDEWSICQSRGKAYCGKVLEARYDSFLNTSTIDQLASVGVNTVRIVTTYAAWIKAPGSFLYSGKQVEKLQKIAFYAIDKYNMHVIIGLHSLPGGTNFLDIGEAFGHEAWFNNATNLQLSYDAVEAVLKFINNSGRKQSFTIAPINEASDTKTVGFGTPAALTANGAAWVEKYFHGVIARVKKVDKRIPIMFQDCFQGAAFWSPKFAKDANIVFDTHVYFFPIPGSFANNVTSLVCERAKALEQGSNFPVYVGEWSLQVLNNNTFAGRTKVFDVQRSAYAKYASGSTFWTAVAYNTELVNGEGSQRDYWSYTDLVKEKVVKGKTSPCSC